MRKNEVIKMIGFAGTAIGILGSLLSGYAQQAEIKKTVEEEVAKALSKRA